jgi:ParB family chromosome partitioning protein
MVDSEKNKLLRKRVLGRGLAHLIGGPASGRAPEESAKHLRGSSICVDEIPVDQIVTHPQQPRANFNPKELDELAASIKEYGFLQPVVVSRSPNGQFRLIAGERRFRAAKILGLKTVPGVIRDDTISQDKAYELALIENIQRSDLSPVEEAKAYQVVMSATGWTQEQLADKMGKERSTITNSLRFLKLHPNVLKALDDGTISSGHAKILCGLPFEQQFEWFQVIKQKHLSVRGIEQLIQEQATPKRRHKKVRRDPDFDPQYEAMRKKSEENLSARVEIKAITHHKGQVVVTYHERRVLNTILEKLSR